MMVKMLMKGEDGATTDKQQWLLMFTNLLHLRQEILPDHRRGGWRVRKAKNKDRNRLAVAMLLDSDLLQRRSNTCRQDCRRQFRMNNEVFMWVVFGVREYATHFIARKTALDYGPSHQFFF
jgi:hypothetical protein